MRIHKNKIKLLSASKNATSVKSDYCLLQKILETTIVKSSEK